MRVSAAPTVAAPPTQHIPHCEGPCVPLAEEVHMLSGPRERSLHASQGHKAKHRGGQEAEDGSDKYRPQPPTGLSSGKGRWVGVTV